MRPSTQASRGRPRTQNGGKGESEV